MNWTPIETDRLILRPLILQDTKQFHEILQDFEVSRNLQHVPHPFEFGEAMKMVREFSGSLKNYRFAAISLMVEPEKLIGTASFGPIPNSNDPEMGYWLGREYWNQGYMSEAGSKLIEVAFTDCGAKCLRSGFWNPISGRLLKKWGFLKVGSRNNLCRATQTVVTEQRVLLTLKDWLAEEKGRAV